MGKKYLFVIRLYAVCPPPHPCVFVCVGVCVRETEREGACMGAWIFQIQEQNGKILHRKIAVYSQFPQFLQEKQKHLFQKSVYGHTVLYKYINCRMYIGILLIK